MVSDSINNLSYLAQKHYNFTFIKKLISFVKKIY
jgi:hypothetical protein